MGQCPSAKSLLENLQKLYVEDSTLVTVDIELEYVEQQNDQESKEID